MLKNHVDGEHRCQDFIIEAMKFHLLKGDLKLQMSLTSPRTKPRQPVGLPKVMLAIGGQAPKAIRSVSVSVADPGCLSRIPDPTFFHSGSRIRTVSIPDPGPHQRI
jgi:hypothetical protein